MTSSHEMLLTFISNKKYFAKLNYDNSGFSPEQQQRSSYTSMTRGGRERLLGGPRCSERGDTFSIYKKASASIHNRVIAARERCVLDAERPRPRRRPPATKQLLIFFHFNGMYPY
ncbi:hypothetical protein EVAR_22581_1 [Eumeta japonica]|uniref:Uncharacterized protein n=1 Tax=Eumeta variegata TaxID=151549 RepID=A0A4C1U7F0_EUMVA|nr:hypothetical protein EVAR_22581_1 [Eumeta japonica]